MMMMLTMTRMTTTMMATMTTTTMMMMTMMLLHLHATKDCLSGLMHYDKDDLSRQLSSLLQCISDMRE